MKFRETMAFTPIEEEFAKHILPQERIQCQKLTSETPEPDTSGPKSPWEKIDGYFYKAGEKYLTLRQAENILKTCKRRPKEYVGPGGYRLFKASDLQK